MSVIAALNMAAAHAEERPPQPAQEEGSPTPAASASAAEIESLRQQVEALSKTVGALQEQLDSQKKLWSGFHAPASSPTDAPLESAGGGPDGGRSAIEALRSEVEALKNSQRQVKTGLFNPDISAAVDFVTSYSKEANNWNFTLRSVELTVQSNIDQYARAYITLNAETELAPTEKLDLFEHANLAVEEAAIVTTSLPGGLQLRAGQFFADFTRLGKVHAHDLPFVDRPLSLDQIIGGEAKSRGLELNWVPPTSHYFRLTAGLVDNIGAEMPVTSRLGESYSHDEGHEEEEEHGHGGTSAFRDRPNRPFKSLMAYGRAATLFELGSSTILRVGADYAQSSQTTKRQIASADAKIEWQPDPATYDLFEAGAETLWTKQSGTLSDEALAGGPSQGGNASAYGGYAYAQYRFGKVWQPGVRVDYLHSDTLELTGDESAPMLGKFSANVWTYSTYLTLHLSEYNRLRLQLNYVHSDREIVPGKGNSDLQAFFQWTVLLGTHKHDFQP